MSYSSDLVDVWTAIRKLHGDAGAIIIRDEVMRARKERELRPGWIRCEECGHQRSPLHEKCTTVNCPRHYA